MTFDSEREDLGVQLPAREAEILGLAAKGLTDKQISAELGISRDTVSTYWRRILLRYKAANRTEVVARAVESELTRKVNEAERVSARLMLEIHERSEAQARDLADRNLLVAVQSALLAFVSGAHQTQDIFQNLLADAVSLTESEFGFIAEVITDDSGEQRTRNLALTNVAWNEHSRVRYSELLNDFSNPCTDGFISEIVGSGTPLVINGRRPSSAHQELPDGHPEIRTFIGIPIFSNNEMVGVIGISNRVAGYELSVASYMEPLLASCSAMICGLRADRDKGKD